MPGDARGWRRVQPLIEKGFKGPELGEALRRERLTALKAYKQRAAV